MPLKRSMSALAIAAMLMPLGGCVPNSGGRSSYGGPPPPPPSGDYYHPDSAANYDAGRDYRADPNYDRPLTRDDRVLLKVDETSNTKIWFSRSAIHQKPGTRWDSGRQQRMPSSWYVGV